MFYNGGICAKENIALLLGNSLDFQIQQQIEIAVNEHPEFSEIKSIITNDFGPCNQIVVIELTTGEKFKIADIQKAAVDLSLTLEKMFDFKIIVYWSSKRNVPKTQSDIPELNTVTAAENTNAKQDVPYNNRAVLPLTAMEGKAQWANRM